MFGLTVRCRNDKLSPPPSSHGAESSVRCVKWQLRNFLHKDRNMVDELIGAVARDLISSHASRQPTAFNYPLLLEVRSETGRGRRDAYKLVLDSIWSRESDSRRRAELIPESRRARHLQTIGTHRAYLYRMRYSGLREGAAIYVCISTSGPFEMTVNQFFNQLTVEDLREQLVTEPQSPYKCLLYISAL